MSKPVKRDTSRPQPLVLYYTRDAGKMQQIEMLCGQFGYKTKLFGEADADCFVGKTAGIGGTYPAAGGKSAEAAGRSTKAEQATANAPEKIAGKAPEGYRQPEIMIFSGISSEALDMFLGAWRMAGIAPIPLKAILTPYNYTWTLYQLTQELIREHTAMMMERRK